MSRIVIDGTIVSVDGVVPGGGTPSPTSGKLDLLYFSAEALQAAILVAKPLRQVWIDSDTGPAQPGSGPDLPAIRYGTVANKTIVVAMDAADPYFTEPGKPPAPVDAMAAAMPLVKAALDATPTDQTKLWETTPSTLDPGSMRVLLFILGGNQKDADDYRKWYYKTYGRQCTITTGDKGAPPHNYEILTDAELAAIVNS